MLKRFFTVLIALVVILVPMNETLAYFNANEAWMVDPLSVMLSITEDRLRSVEICATAERATLFYPSDSSDTSIITEYTNSLLESEHEITLYSLQKTSVYSTEDIIEAVLMGSHELSEEKTAFGVIEKLMGKKGYCYAEHLSGIPDHIAAISCNGTLKAILYFSFESDTAVTTAFFPVLNGLNLETIRNKYDWFPQITPVEKLPRLTEADKKNIIIKLRQYINNGGSAEEAAVSLARKIGIHAKQYDPLIQASEKEMRSFALSCRIFAEEPSRIFCLSGNDLAIPESYAAELKPVALATSISVEEIWHIHLSLIPNLFVQTNMWESAAMERMKEQKSVSFPDQEDKLFLLVYENETDYPDLCYVSIFLNENGCFDLTASPLFGNSTTNGLITLFQTGSFLPPSE